MPRFFFHVHDGASVPDTEGTELTDILEAQSEAVRLTGELLREIGRDFWKARSWKLDVADHTGRALFTLSLIATEQSDVPDEA